MSKKTSITKQILNSKKEAKLKNYIVILLDSSASMGGIHSQAVKTYNTLLETIRDKAEDEDQETLVTFATFDTRHTTHFENARPSALNEISTSFYRSNGDSTALFDSFGKLVESAKSVYDANHDNVSFLVISITDGQDNSSYTFNANRVKDLINDCQATGRWTFAFQLPPGQANSFCSKYGVSRDNVREWEGTTAGMREVENTTQTGLNSYFSSRGLGLKSLTTFYKETDLSQVKKTDLLDLTNVTHQFKIFEVPKEMPIKDFTEQKTGQPYVIGQTAYQISKNELIQPNKKLYIMEKGKNTIYGGDKTRDLIGLPKNGNVKIEPGNHASYNLFCDSTSVNRKLVRGTKVLINIYKNKNDVPTWKN